MSLTKRAYRKYREEGFLETALSSSRYLTWKATGPIAPILYDQFSYIRYEDVLNTTECERYKRLDHNSEQHVDADIPFSMTCRDNSFRNLPRYSFNDQYVTEFHNIRILGPDAVPITTNGDVIAEAIEPALEEGYRLKQALRRLLCDTSAMKSYLTHPKQEINCVCSLVTSWNNYYHWMVEHLPKIRAVEKITSSWNIDPTFLIPADPPEYVTDSLELLGYSEDDWIEWRGGAILAKKYIQPTFTEPTVKVCKWIRNKILTNISLPTSESSGKIYISRENANTRKIINRKQVTNILNKYNFTVITAETLSLPQQAKTFCSADIILSPHGAGLTNIIWPENTTVIEIFNNVVKNPYFQISNELDHKYYSIQGKPVDDRGLNSNIVVDTDKLDTLFQNIGIQNP